MVLLSVLCWYKTFFFPSLSRSHWAAFISSCSLQVCGENTTQRISMKGGKGPITRKNMDRMGQMRKWADVISFFPPAPFFQNDFRDGVVVFCFSALISSRVCSRQILSERAVLVLIQSRKNVVIKCNSSAINYTRMLSVFCVWALVCVLTVCVCVLYRGGQGAYIQ